MKLLFDENRSAKLAERLSDICPYSSHVSLIGLEGFPDKIIWDRAKSDCFTIVSKDNDFRQRSFLFGMPPKVIGLQIGNAGTDAVEGLLRRERARIYIFAENVEESLLVLKL